MIDYAVLEAKTNNIARQMIAERAKVDLYYLCSYVLGGEEVLDPKVHGPLCRALRPLLFYKNPESIQGVEFPSDYGRTDDEGMPDEDEKQAFLEWQHKFMPDPDTNAVEDKFNIYLNKLLALMPRGTLKSTIITIGFVIQWHLNFPNDRVLIDSETWTKSKAFLTEISGHYKINKRLRTVYGTLYKNEDGSAMTPNQNEKSDTWSTEALNLSCRERPRKEPSIDCAGIEVTKTGMHYDLIIGDDLHSEKNTKEVEQIEKVKEHYRLLYSLLDPGASMAIVGTRWDDDDLYQMIIDEQSAEFNFITRSAESDDGDLLFPSRLTRAVLDNFRKIQGGYIYSCQYLNNPVDQENATFVVSQFKRISIEEFNMVRTHLFGFVDPSYKGKANKSDYAAFVLGAMGPRREIYCRHAFKDKMKYSQIFDKMATLDEMFSPRIWIVEAIGTKSLEDDFDRMNELRALSGKQRLKIRYIRSQPNTKVERIADLSPWYERGDAYHVIGGGMIAELEGELKRFPKAKNDDLSDCWSGIIKNAYPPKRDESDEAVQRRKKYTKILNKPRSPLMGY